MPFVGDARFEIELLLLFEGDEELQSEQIETLRHAAKIGGVPFADEAFELVRERVLIEIFQRPVPREGDDFLSSAHRGALLSLPLPRGYFSGVGLHFLTARMVRSPMPPGRE